MTLDFYADPALPLVSVMARLKLIRVPQLLVTACLLAAFGLVLLVR